MDTQVPEMKQVELKLELTPSEKLLSLLTPEEIYNRLDQFIFSQLKEDRRIERKSTQTTPRVLGDYFSMWANTSPDGGLLFIGVENDGDITGCAECSSTQLNDIEDSARIYCSDARVESTRIQVSNSKGHEDFIVVFRVQYRHDKVVKNSAGKAFIRSGDKKKELSEDEVRELQISKGEVHHELEPIALKYPEDFNEALLKEFAKNIKKAKELEYVHSISQLLAQQRLGTFENGRFIPNNACCLLFSKDPVLSFPGCKLRIMRFDGEVERSGEKYALVKDIMIEGPVPKIIADAEKAIDSQLREYSALGQDGRFYAIPEYPKVAWYEAIVNACVHRSYNLKNMHVFVKIFDDRLEITSPGGFPPMVTPANVFTTHNPRNPILMEALRYFGYVKCANEGTKRMRDAMVENRLPEPRFGETSSNHAINVVVTLQNDYKHRRRFIDNDAARRVVSESVFKSLSDEDRRLINSVAEYGSINVSQAARILEREWGTARNKLEKLVNMGVLRRDHRKDLLRDPKAKYVLNAP